MEQVSSSIQSLSIKRLWDVGDKDCVRDWLLTPALAIALTGTAYCYYKHRYHQGTDFDADLDLDEATGGRQRPQPRLSNYQATRDAAATEKTHAGATVASNVRRYPATDTDTDTGEIRRCKRNQAAAAPMISPADTDALHFQHEHTRPPMMVRSTPDVKRERVLCDADDHEGCGIQRDGINKGVSQNKVKLNATKNLSRGDQELTGQGGLCSKHSRYSDLSAGDKAIKEGRVPPRKRADCVANTDYVAMVHPKVLAMKRVALQDRELKSVKSVEQGLLQVLEDQEVRLVAAEKPSIPSEHFRVVSDGRCMVVTKTMPQGSAMRINFYD